MPEFLTILKVVVLLVGFGFSMAYFIQGIKDKNRVQLKRAGLIFLSTWILIILITTVEFVLL
jgi:hypothetical protein